MIKLTDKPLATSSASGDNIFINRNGAIMQVGMSNFSPPIVPTVSGNVIAVTDSSDRPLVDLTVFGNTSQNGTPTPEAPVDLVGVKNPTVTINGKNLLENKITSETVNGLTISANDDGSITVDGTSTASFSRTINSEIILPTGKYTISGGKETNARLEFRSVKTDGSTNGFHVTNTEAHITITDDVISSSVIIVFISGTVFDNYTFKPMIRLASITDDTYEPFKSQTLSVPYTLNGVGEVKDYVDFERGVLVKNCEKIRLTSSMTWGLSANQHRIYAAFSNIYPSAYTPILCSHFKNANWLSTESGTIAWGNNAFPVCGVSTADFATVDEFKSWLDAQTDGVYVIVPLVTPTETPLTSEEIEAFKQLQSYYPTTTITNSENAEMSVEYVADTKNYIDQKLASLVASATTDTTEV